MTEYGKVLTVSRGIAVVALSGSEGCSGCTAACVGCGKVRKVKGKCRDEVEVGEKVALTSSDRTIVLLMLGVLLVPAMITAGAYLLLSRFFSGQTIPALISCAAVVVYLLVFGFLGRAGGYFLPTVTKLPEEDAIHDTEEPPSAKPEDE